MPLTKIKNFFLVFTESDIAGVRILLALSSIMWAILLLLDPTTFTRPVYIRMDDVANSHVWASIFMLHGISSIIALHNKYSYPLYLLEAVLGTVIWTASLTCIALSIVTPSIPPVYASFILGALSSWWVLFKYPIKR